MHMSIISSVTVFLKDIVWSDYANGVLGKIILTLLPVPIFRALSGDIYKPNGAA